MLFSHPFPLKDLDASCQILQKILQFAEILPIPFHWESVHNQGPSKRCLESLQQVVEHLSFVVCPNIFLLELLQPLFCIFQTRLRKIKFVSISNTVRFLIPSFSLIYVFSSPDTYLQISDLVFFVLQFLEGR